MADLDIVVPVSVSLQQYPTEAGTFNELKINKPYSQTNLSAVATFGKLGE